MFNSSPREETPGTGAILHFISAQVIPLHLRSQGSACCIPKGLFVLFANQCVDAVRRSKRAELRRCGFGCHRTLRTTFVRRCRVGHASRKSSRGGYVRMGTRFDGLHVLWWGRSMVQISSVSVNISLQLLTCLK